MIKRRWTKKNGFVYYITKYNRETRKSESGGTFPTLQDAEAAVRADQRLRYEEKSRVPSTSTNS